MSQQEALFLLCGYPILLGVVFALIGWFWRNMELSARENDTKRFPRYSPKPAPTNRFIPWRKHPDMLDDTDLSNKKE
jgi:hypothetical protein